MKTAIEKVDLIQVRVVALRDLKFYGIDANACGLHRLSAEELHHLAADVYVAMDRSGKSGFSAGMGR